MFADVFKNKKVLITGNTGFKGSWLSIWLCQLGADVYGVSKDIPTQPSIFEELKLASKIHYVQQDIRDLSALKRIVDACRPDFLFHLAAQPIVSQSYKDPLETITTNVLGTTHILEILRTMKHKCCAVIVTSDKCYDNVEWVWGYRENDHLGGKDVYSGSKGAAELVFKCYYHSFLKNSPVRVGTARAGNVIGGGDWALNRIVPDAMRSWSLEKPVEIRSPKSTRPWQHVLEPLSGYLALAQALFQETQASHGESYNFGPKAEQNHTVSTILEDLSTTWRYTDKTKSYQVTSDVNFAESGLLKLSCDKALHHLHWMPTLDYEQMIKFVSEWYYKFYRTKESMYDFTIQQIQKYEGVAFEKGLSWTR